VLLLRALAPAAEHEVGAAAAELTRELVRAAPQRAVTAQRLEESAFQQSCAGGAVSLDLDLELEAVRLSVVAFFDQTMALFARHFPLEDKRRARAFAGLLLTAIEGGYIRGRAERSSRAFREAAQWLAELAERE
jgi:hypothetical protein